MMAKTTEKAKDSQRMTTNTSTEGPPPPPLDPVGEVVRNGPNFRVSMPRMFEGLPDWNSSADRPADRMMMTRMARPS